MITQRDVEDTRALLDHALDRAALTDLPWWEADETQRAETKAFTEIPHIQFAVTINNGADVNPGDISIELPSAVPFAPLFLTEAAIEALAEAGVDRREAVGRLRAALDATPFAAEDSSPRLDQCHQIVFRTSIGGSDSWMALMRDTLCCLRRPR